VYGGEITSMQHVRKWFREFEKGQADTYDDDCASWSSTSKMDVNEARMEKQTLETHESQFKADDSTVMEKWKWVFMNGYE
jgi:hypothetical protein